jgi:RNA polymerase sigma factor (TIGR02999 family)
VVQGGLIAMDLGVETMADLDSRRAHPAGVSREIYDELKRIAHRHLRVLDANATLSTTEVVHEAYLKLARSPSSDWDGRAHFFASASRAMRQVLVDFARRRRAAKRGGDRQPITLRDVQARLEIELDEVLALDAALDRLDTVAPRLRRVVELRFFGGVPDDDIARMLGVSTRTVERDWLKARLLLLELLEPVRRPEPGSGAAQA